MLKISYKLIEPYRAKKRKKPVRHGYCKLCGSKLKAQKSIELGIGRGCMGRHVAIVLEIVPDDICLTNQTMTQSSQSRVLANPPQVTRPVGQIHC